MIPVIIPNYNGSNLLSMSIDSLKNQTYKDIEIVVVDDCSTDNSCEMIRSKYPEVRLIRNERNSGFSVTVNRGIRETEGEYVALFNNDASAEPTWLEELVKGMESDENIGICASKMKFYFERDKIDSAGVGMYDDGMAYNRGANEKDEGQFDKREYIFGSCAGASLYRRKMLEDISIDGQFFDEDFVAYLEDVDVDIRSQLYGYKCLYLPDALVYHIGSATNRRAKIIDGKIILDEVKLEKPKPFILSGYAFYYSSCNTWNLILKNMPISFFLQKMWKSFVFEFLLHFLYSAKHFALPTYLASRFRSTKQILAMLKKRKIIQAKKKISDEYFYSILTPRKMKFYSNIIKKKIKGS